MKQKPRTHLRAVLAEWGIITLGTAIVAAAVFFFLVPSKLSVGSVSGLAIVLANVIPLPVSAITMALNVLFLVLGFLLIGGEFGAKTVYTSILLPLVLGALERLFPNNGSIMGDQFLDMLCYTMLVSLGLALLFVRNASSGGLDIAAKILNRYFHMELGAALAAAGMVVALSSALVYDAKTVALSIIGTYLGGIVLDHFIFGLNTKKKVSILSSHVEEIRKFVLEDLHSGATLYEAIGAYDYAEQRELVTIVNKAEYAKLMTFLAKVDKDAFVTVYTVHEVFYRPKPGRSEGKRLDNS